MFKKLRVALTVTMLGMPLAAFAQNPLYVSPSGNDDSDCLSAALPCATIQRAVDLAPKYAQTSILLSHGTYSAGAKVAHYKFVTIDGDCANRYAVTISNPPGGTAFTAQDFGILGIQCVVITGGSIGLLTRQFSVLDYVKITFGPMAVHISAGESSKINC